MIFKPFVLLASALATLQVANGAALAERDVSLCCTTVVDLSSLGQPAIGIITGLAAAAGVTVSPDSEVATGCSAVVDPCIGTVVTCATSVGPVLTLGTVGVLCGA
ncbi:hypothetical protein R3P38DRAFT_3262255 [Favolaschia claudopus]|uniref:Hydrophobin n=1 Tax=Favolaschia claudopus TaxID=2862362 RepID=A0AAW0CMB0_9AGAR